MRATNLSWRSRPLATTSFQGVGRLHSCAKPHQHMIKTEFTLGRRFVRVAKFFDASVQFFVELIDLLAAFFVLPNLPRDFVDLIQYFASARIFHYRYPSECPVAQRSRRSLPERRPH